MFRSLKQMLSSIFTWVSKSFSHKLMLLLLVCMYLVTGFSSAVYYYTTSKLLQEQYVNSNEMLLTEVNQSVSRYYKGLDEVTLSLYKDDSFIENLRLHRNDYLSVTYNEQQIKNILSSDRSIQYIYFYDPYEQNLYSYSRENVSCASFPQLEREDWYLRTIHDPQFLYISPLHTFQNYQNFGSLKNNTVFSVNRALRYYATGEIIGVISISYDTSHIEEICQNLASNGEYIAVLDKDLSPRLTTYPEDYVLDGNIKKRLQSDSIQNNYKYSTGKEDRLLLWNATDDIYLMKDMPLNKLTKNVLIVSQIVLLLSVSIFILSIVIAIYFSNSATRRLKQLTQNIVEFSDGNLEMDAADYGKDEIGLMAAAFHDMTDRINELINQEYKAKMLKKNAELQALQAQVNPHFINNALQALGTLGLKKGASDVYQMANNLARVLRYTLKSTQELVPLETEIENLENYLYIQKILWDDRLKIDLQIESGLERMVVPVFILQPLVDNSLKHGLANCTEGLINIEIKTIDSCLSIKVTDNGTGIPPASLYMLRQWIDTDLMENLDEHVGIRNIAGRIRLIYGKKARLEITSQPGRGTCIQIILPERSESHV